MQVHLRDVMQPHPVEKLHSVGASDGRLRVGEVLDGRFAVQRFIAEGAASRVYAARDVTRGGWVAVKVARADLGDDPLGRFRVEVDAYRRIRSQHVPKLHGEGRTSAGAAFMALDLLRGRTLSEWLSWRSMSIAAVLELGQQLAAALSAVHEQGIVHCDIKPRNVMLESDAERGRIVKLIDFGICTIQGLAQEISHRDTVVGTPQYMSPEQILGGEVEPLTDVYSASAVLYQALTRRLPFNGGNDRDVMLAALRDPVVPPRLVREDCPKALELVLLRGLSREPGARFSTADEMARAFQEVALELGFRNSSRAFESRPVRVIAADPTAITRRTPSVGVRVRWVDSPEREEPTTSGLKERKA